jgi:hypothetical protein
MNKYDPDADLPIWNRSRLYRWALTFIAIALMAIFYLMAVRYR